MRFLKMATRQPLDPVRVPLNTGRRRLVPGRQRTAIRERPLVHLRLQMFKAQRSGSPPMLQQMGLRLALLRLLQRATLQSVTAHPRRGETHSVLVQPHQETSVLRLARARLPLAPPQSRSGGVAMRLEDRALQLVQIPSRAAMAVKLLASMLTASAQTA